VRRLLLLGAILVLVVLSTVVTPAEDKELLYEVLNPACAEYLGKQIPDDVLQLWLDNGWIVPVQGAPQQGNECHLYVRSCGPGCTYTDCIEGAGTISCWCDYSVLPPNQ
jgi:hypothetical protein